MKVTLRLLAAAGAPAVLATALGLQCSPVLARDHVLVMTISQYPTQPLLGVRFDAENALKLANKLGYDTQAPMVLRDGQLTSKGLRDALDNFAKQVEPNDRAFIYYSGHGASLLQANQCVQALVGIDGGFVQMGELSAKLDQIKSRTSDVLVVIDACHSGGLNDIAVTRTTPIDADEDENENGQSLAPKAWHNKAGEACHSPVNFAKAWSPGVPQPGTRAVFPQNNFVFIAAANEREVALDNPDKGGLATTSLLSCVENGVADTDGSGAISAVELAACAQKNIALEVPMLNARKGSRWTPHTVETNGNTKRSLLVAPLPAAMQVAAPAVAAPSLAQRTLAAFEQIVAGANGNWAWRADMPAIVKLGGSAPVRYSTQHPGFLSILYVGSDQKDIQVLAANVSVDTTLENQTRLLGNIPISEPAGVNTFLLYLSQAPIDATAMLGAAAQGDKVLVTAAVLQSVQCSAGLAARARGAGIPNGGGPCPPTGRNAGMLQVAKGGGVGGYGAVVLNVMGNIK
jgi:hypothetical protein